MLKSSRLPEETPFPLLPFEISEPMEALERKNANNEFRSFFRIAGVTVCVETPQSADEHTFQEKFKPFAVEGPGPDTVYIQHHFFLPDIDGFDLGSELYNKKPWGIYRKGDYWIYIGILEDSEKGYNRVAVFNKDHTRGRLYGDMKHVFDKGGLHSLTFFPTDQILLVPILADREACIIHSSGIGIGNRGFLFVGHSDAGKSTISMLLKDRGRILCDDRNIVRRMPDKFHVFGTWSHGDVPDVSSEGAPLEAIFFLEQAPENRIIPVDDPGERTRRLLACLIKSVASPEWWEKTLTIIERIAGEVPCFILRFDKTGGAADLVENFSS